MRYLGGKTKIGKRIAHYLNSLRDDNQMYYEPFVGACGVFQHMANPKEGSDSSKDLMLMFNALLNGWVPPVHISKDMYTKLKKFPPSPLRSFVGFGCSFGGNWFSGYADGSRNFAREAHNSLIAMLPRIKGATFHHRDYRRCEFEPGSLVYCDPPYAYNIGYGAAGELDIPVFWDKVREWSLNSTVLVSSYDAPPDFHSVMEISTLSGTRANGREQKTRTERLHRMKQIKVLQRTTMDSVVKEWIRRAKA